nr:MAG: nonstructural protein [Microvirus sp.]QJB19697.1 MAG: nonstructural protein [Microvirus sp.]
MKVLVALYDRATEAHAPIMTVHTKGEAIRSFRQAVNDKQTPINANPTDYELWQVGTYDDEAGTITPHKELIARAEDHKE